MRDSCEMSCFLKKYNFSIRCSHFLHHHHLGNYLKVLMIFQAKLFSLAPLSFAVKLGKKIQFHLMH